MGRLVGGVGGCVDEGSVILPDQAVRIVIATKPPLTVCRQTVAGQRVDFRKGHVGLASMAKQSWVLLRRRALWWCFAQNAETG